MVDEFASGNGESIERNDGSLRTRPDRFVIFFFCCFLRQTISPTMKSSRTTTQTMGRTMSRTKFVERTEQRPSISLRLIEPR